MNVVINGELNELEAGSTVADVIQRSGRDPAARGIAVALNGEVVPRASWHDTKVSDNDRVEVLGAVQGG